MCFQKKISIIICTYNRSKLLSLALDSLVVQSANSKNFEILVIDNNSKDNTREIVDKYIKRYPKHKIKYFLEKKQGISYARNRGAKEAKYEYFAYIDDDAKAIKDWIQNILFDIKKIKPDILGGPIYPYYLSSKPRWFKDEYEIRQIIKNNGFLTAKQIIPTGNLVIKKKLFSQVKGFDETLEIGEDTNFIIKSWRKKPNLKVYYNQKVSVLHFVKKDRMKVKERLAQSFRYGKLHYRIWMEEPKNVFSSFLGLSMISLLVVLKFVYRFFLRKKGQKYVQNVIFEEINPLFPKLGKYFSVFI